MKGQKIMLTLDKVYHAAFALKNTVRKTDLIYAPGLSGRHEVFLKTENLQLTGSFKIRGAYYKVSKLSDEQRAKGIIACSAGNHAQGVALACEKSQTPCLICMPDGAPISKVEATKKYGAEVVLVKGAYDDAYETALALQQEKGYTFIHPFDDIDVIAGQATIGLEILDQLADVDAIVLPIGGGGLAAGVAYAIKNLKPDCKVYGVQAAGAPAMAEAMKNNAIKSVAHADTFADGIAVKCPGEKTYALLQSHLDGIVTVTEDEIAAAILMLMEKQKLVTEGAGAVAVAAVMFQKIDLKGKKTVCVLSGGNIDVNILNRVITRGLIMSGRKTTLTFALVDKPGQLNGVSEVISRCGGNVVAVHHDNSDPNMPVNSCLLRVILETRDEAHVKMIRGELEKAGFALV